MNLLSEVHEHWQMCQPCPRTGVRDVSGLYRLCVRHPWRRRQKRTARRRRASRVRDDACDRVGNVRVTRDSSKHQSPPRSPTCTPSGCGESLDRDPAWRTPSRASRRATHVQAFGLKSAHSTGWGRKGSLSSPAPPATPPRPSSAAAGQTLPRQRHSPPCRWQRAMSPRASPEP